MIPKQHTENLVECGEDTAAHLMETVKSVSEHYVNSCGYQGVNILNASGESAQQSVPHLHFHIIPRRRDDGLNAWPSLGKNDSDLAEVCRQLSMISLPKEEEKVQKGGK